MNEEEKDKRSKMMSYMSNPRAFTLKKWFGDLLKGFYREEHNQTIDRIAGSFIVDKDLEDFGKLMGALYESGYRTAVKDLKAQMKEKGYNIEVKSD